MGTYAFSDIHGNYNLWTSIKKYYKSDDKLIFLGDACDRGSKGIKIMQEMLNDNRVIYILGNHEQMFLEYIKDIDTALKNSKDQIIHNGSYQTLMDYKELMPLEQEQLIKKLQEKTKKYFIYINKEKKNIFLSHAGMNLENLNNIDENKILWDRDHIKNTKAYNNKYKYWYVVHGHTPVQILHPEKSIVEIYRYYNNHKIDIDIGTPNSNQIAVLNLDNLQVKYFKDKEAPYESRNNETSTK